MTNLIPHEHIERRIFTIRGLRVMFDSDLAGLFEVETRALNQAVKRNIRRFPLSFMFQLTQEEYENLKSQIVTSSAETPSESNSWGGRRKLPSVFTEHGVLMLANVLKSDRATDISIRIIETFVKLRQVILTYSDIAKKIEEIEGRLSGQDEQFQIFQELILPLLEVNISNKRKIGFELDRKKSPKDRK